MLLIVLFLRHPDCHWLLILVQDVLHTLKVYARVGGFCGGWINPRLNVCIYQQFRAFYLLLIVNVYFSLRRLPDSQGSPCKQGCSGVRRDRDRVARMRWCLCV